MLISYNLCLKLINYKVIPKGRHLNENGQSQIAVLLTNKVKISAIATTVGRSRCVVRNFIDKGEFYGNKKKTEKNTKLSAHDRRQICRLASTELTTSCKI